jgi:predicted Fe-Mo cluster-binding NifX family protein
MRIAMPADYSYINQHFGKAREFAILDLDGDKVSSVRMVSAESLAHNHAGLAGLLKGEQVEVVIVGGIGPYALEALEGNELKVITGARGKIDDIAGAYARGELVSKRVVCNHHHGDHHHHHHGGK